MEWIELAHRVNRHRLALQAFLTLALAVMAAGAWADSHDDDDVADDKNATTSSVNDGCDEACQAARKAQDPLAEINALLTDFTHTFGPDTWDSNTRSDNYQFQPVYTPSGLEGGKLILRGIIPLDSQPASPVPTPFSTAASRNTGLGDSTIQAFWVPDGQDDSFKIGYGPQVSLPTHTKSELKGLGWGIGAVLVGFGAKGGLSYGGIIGHTFAENSASVSLMQPIIFYNTSFLGGSYFGYNNSITYNWKADSGNKWSVPLGLTVGKSFILGSGGVIDVQLGAYKLVESPAGAGDRQIKWAVSFIAP